MPAYRFIDNDIVKFSIYCHLEGQQSINRIMYRCQGKIGLGLEDQDAANQYHIAVAALMKVWMNNQTTIAGTRVQVMRPIQKNYVVSQGVVVLGTDVGNPLPSQAAVCVRFLTDTVGKMNRGRIYLPFWTDSFLAASGALTGAAITKAANFAEYASQPITMLDVGGLNGTTFVPIIDSKGSTKTVPPTPAHVTPITGAKVDPFYATQRRRSQINRPDFLGP